jgi:hypothetical protein
MDPLVSILVDPRLCAKMAFTQTLFTTHSAQGPLKSAVLPPLIYTTTTTQHQSPQPAAARYLQPQSAPAAASGDV